MSDRKEVYPDGKIGGVGTGRNGGRANHNQDILGEEKNLFSVEEKSE